MAIELNDDEIMKVAKASALVQERLSGKSYKPDDFVGNMALKQWVAETFATVGGVEVIVKMVEQKVKTSDSTFQSIYVPDIDIVGRIGTQGERIDEYIKTETDWERKEWDAKHHTVEELNKKTDGVAESLID